jgi:hypothetical protein
MATWAQSPDRSTGCGLASLKDLSAKRQRAVVEQRESKSHDHLGRRPERVFDLAFRQHRSLRRADEYFRGRAVNPVVIENETIVHERADGMIVSAVTFKSGKSRMQLNAVHDMIAVI